MRVGWVCGIDKVLFVKLWWSDLIVSYTYNMPTFPYYDYARLGDVECGQDRYLVHKVL